MIQYDALCTVILSCQRNGGGQGGPSKQEFKGQYREEAGSISAAGQLNTMIPSENLVEHNMLNEKASFFVVNNMNIQCVVRSPCQIAMSGILEQMEQMDMLASGGLDQAN